MISLCLWRDRVSTLPCSDAAAASVRTMAAGERGARGKYSTRNDIALRHQYLSTRSFHTEYATSPILEIFIP
jgi:hypothetical protein